jgi:hypothetical protein
MLQIPDRWPVGEVRAAVEFQSVQRHFVYAAKLHIFRRVHLREQPVQPDEMA